jgi:hypothetical protein
VLDLMDAAFELHGVAIIRNLDGLLLEDRPAVFPPKSATLR